MSEDKGPYRIYSYNKEMIDGPTGLHGLVLKDEYLVNTLNAAYAAGIKDGRASRDGLREALLYVAAYCNCGNRSIVDEALEADGEVGK